MKLTFEPSSGLVLVKAALLGGKRDLILRLCLDTGAEKTLLSDKVIARAGFEIEENAERFPLSTAGSQILAPRVVLPKLFALETSAENFSVYVHALPPETKIHGLLGLDFMRGHVLTLDFKTGEIDFE